MFIHRGFFVFFIIFSCHQRQEKLQKKRRLRWRGFRKKKSSEPHFLLLQHSLPLKNSPLRFDDGVSFNFKSRLRRPGGLIIGFKTGEMAWDQYPINQETKVRDIRKANSEALDSRIILAAEKILRHCRRTQKYRKFLAKLFYQKSLPPEARILRITQCK